MSLSVELGKKRNHIHTSHPSTDDDALFGKRHRSVSTLYSAQARCGDAFAAVPEGPCFVVNEATIQAVRALFPAMDDITFSNVISECGSDIEQAIARLSSLQLAQDHQTSVRMRNLSLNNAAAAAARLLHALPVHALHASTACPSPASTAPSPPSEPTCDAMDGLTIHPRPFHPDENSEPSGPVSHVHAPHTHSRPSPGPPAAAPAAPAGLSPRTADQWVELVVAEMTVSVDVQDARARAVRVLKGFQEAVLYSQAETRSKELEPIRSKMTELVRDNQILKRAVQIQSEKLREAAAADKDREIAELRGMLQQAQEANRQLELSNYALATHLRQVFQPRGEERGPDVF